MKKLSVEGSNGFSTYAIPQSDHVNALVMDGTAQSLTVPADAKHALFSSTEDFYAKIGDAVVAEVPAANVTDGSASELRPGVRLVVPGQTISVIGAAGTIVTVSFYG